MSRSNNTEITNPATRFFKWNSENGCLKWWDKDAEKDVFVKLPFSFMALDRLHTIAGFSDADQGGIWSNEIKDIKKQSLTVKTKKNLIAEGLYDLIKDKVKAAGGKYGQSIYICYKNEAEEYVIGNLQLVGAASSELMDFSKGKSIFKGAITIKGFEEKKKGTTTYKVPVFSLKEVTDNADSIAVDLDKELQVYLTAYLNRNSQKEEEQPETKRETLDEYKQPSVTGAEDNSTPQVNFGAEPMPEDDLPF